MQNLPMQNQSANNAQVANSQLASYQAKVTTHTQNSSYEPKNQIGKKVKGALANKALVGVLILLQIVIIGLLVYVINPKQALEDYKNSRLIAKVESKVDVNAKSDPTLAEILDAEGLRAENEIQAQVYKDAQNGDRVLVYQDKIVIYRESEDKVVYEGDSPQTILQKNQEAILTDLTDVADAAGIIAKDSGETPQLSVVTSPVILREKNPDFYEKAQKNDIIATYPDSGIIILYRATDKEILNYGDYKTDITVK